MRYLGGDGSLVARAFLMTRSKLGDVSESVEC